MTGTGRNRGLPMFRMQVGFTDNFEIVNGTLRLLPADSDAQCRPLFDELGQADSSAGRALAPRAVRREDQSDIVLGAFGILSAFPGELGQVSYFERVRLRRSRSAQPYR